MSYRVHQDVADPHALADGVPATLTADTDGEASAGSSHADQDGDHVAVDAVGVVKWFNDQKGFGFISDADGKDV
ncbi:MAG: cold shock domain-containing protein, partial [Planctomycetota bacterium]